MRSESFDRAAGTITVVARLRNTSKSMLRPPLKVRVVQLTSQLGVPAIVGSESGGAGVGAIWDFGRTVPAAGLAPDSATATRTLTFRLTDIRPLQLVRQSPGFTSGLVHFAVNVFGKAGGQREPQL